MRWISVTELCLVDLSCPPSLRGLVGSTQCPRAQTWGKQDLGGFFTAPLWV